MHRSQVGVISGPFVLFKSGKSQGQGNCVEVVFLRDGLVGVRDSKNATGPGPPCNADAGTASQAIGSEGRLEWYKPASASSPSCSPPTSSSTRAHGRQDCLRWAPVAAAVGK